MGWSDPVSVEEMQRRASARRRYNRQRREAMAKRREEVQRLSVRWGTGAAAKVKMSLALHVSITTIGRDLQAVREDPPLPAICPTCGLPSRLDVEVSDLPHDPAALDRLEQAMARLIGVEDAETMPDRGPRRRPTSPQGRLNAPVLAPEGAEPSARRDVPQTLL